MYMRPAYKPGKTWHTQRLGEEMSAVKQPRQPGSQVVIAIDGPAGAGKSTVARRLAEVLGYDYVDSGAMYRAAGWLVQTYALPLESPAAIIACLEQTPITLTCSAGKTAIWVGGQCVTAQVRGEAISRAASAVATMPGVRQALTAQLRHMGAQTSVVMEGRDIGTVVFPDATMKFFLDASPAQRGQRRFQELQHTGSTATLEQVVEAIAARDRQD
ncbi:MAG: (d)CMP kinase, partial [Candidatus Tectomicrobia bacterium]|nr:(d)CMP kinase [Candidatus Tectomicrobia bacterium]